MRRTRWAVSQQGRSFRPHRRRGSTLTDKLADLGQLVPNADPTRIGEALGELYLAVLEKVRQGPEAADTPPGESPTGTGGGLSAAQGGPLGRLAHGRGRPGY